MLLFLHVCPLVVSSTSTGTIQASIFTHKHTTRPDAFVGMIMGNDKPAYTEEVQHLQRWCDNNNLDLNTAKEMLMDFRRSK